MRSQLIASSILGNILEWYDFGLFTIFSPLFSHLFFPASNPRLSLIATFGIFSIGFFCRPLGALFFGYYGDKFGRAKTLRLSVLMIVIPTLLIGLLPTYQQIGIFAPLGLTLIRMWQGISIGGEYSGNLIYLAESSEKSNRGFMTAFASTGSNIGILLALFIGFFFTHYLSATFINHEGWRIPYLLSGILCLILYFTRLTFKETDVFIFLKQNKLLTANPLSTIFKKNRFELLRTFGMVLMGSTFYYFSFVFIPIYLTENLQYTSQTISLIMLLLISLMILLVPFSGMICDYVGRRKMLIFNACLISLFVIPGFYFLHNTNFFIMSFILIIFTIGSALEQGTTSVAIVENFPASTRYTGISLAYNIGNGFLGGTVPFICEWLSTYSPLTLAPAFYIAMCAIMTLAVIYFFVPETKYENLDEE